MQKLLEITIISLFWIRSFKSKLYELISDYTLPVEWKADYVDRHKKKDAYLHICKKQPLVEQNILQFRSNEWREIHCKVI